MLAFYNERRATHVNVKPNAAHLALARLEAEFSGEMLIVTQNVDGLHELAGTRNLIHMHGEIAKAFCAACGHRQPFAEELTLQSLCGACGSAGKIRPDVVWFGEMPYQMEEIYAALEACDLFISIGTSGTVYPAAGFVIAARQAGAHTVELNLEPSEGRSAFHEAVHGPATEVVPAYVTALLSGGPHER